MSKEISRLEKQYKKQANAQSIHEYTHTHTHKGGGHIYK